MARRSSATPIRCAIPWLLSLCLALLVPVRASAGTVSAYTFFQGTQYPLTVIQIQGEEPGPTVMVQGGIQGDEICGAVTAQLLAGCRVLKGNLIVVPRANLPSIHLARRQINVDMNRRFDRDYNRFYEDRVARVIRHLLAGCDGFVHLHEGSGFYSPRPVDDLRGPNRYGQSIIVDAENHAGVDLGGLVRGVLSELNPGIEPERYRLELFNTQTFDPQTRYPEMRKSLTYYVLSVLHIPAMAVEVSKNIRDLGWKVRTQMTATRIILARLGVEVALPEFDDGDVRAVADTAALVRVNGRPLTAGTTIHLSPGATITAEPEAGGGRTYSPALAVFASCGPVFVCWLNGRSVFVESGGTLKIVAGDQLILEGVWGSGRREVLNLKGYVAQPWDNDGQDLGAEIILDPDNFMDKYCLPAETQGTARYQVARETPGATRGFFNLEVEPRRVEALLFRGPHGQELSVPFSAGAEFRLPEGEYELLRAQTNGAEDKLMATAGQDPLRDGQKLRLGDEPLSLTVRQATTFQEMGTLTIRSGRWAEAGTLPALP